MVMPMEENKQLISQYKSGNEKLQKKAITALVNALLTEDKYVRRMTIGALSEINDIRVIETLTKNIQYNPGVAEALYELKDPQAVAPLVDIIEVSTPAREILAAYQDTYIAEEMIRTLEHKNKYKRIGAITVLGKMKEGSAVMPIISLLDDEPEDVVLEAIQALGNIKDARAGAWLCSLLEHENDNIVRAAINALGMLGDVRALEPLIKVIGRYESTLQMRILALTTIGKLKGSRAAAFLIKTLTPDHPILYRKLAASALGNVIDSRAVEPLIAALSDKDPILRENAAMALGKAKDERAVEPLLAVLSNKKSKVRTAALLALAEIQGDRATELLIAALSDKDPALRESAAKALGKVKDGRAVAPLLAVLSDKKNKVRKAALLAFAEIQGDRVAEHVIEALGTSDLDALINETQSLGQIPYRHAVAPLIAALNSFNLDKCIHAVLALGGIRDNRGIEALNKTMQTSKGEEVLEVLVAAAETLKKIELSWVIEFILNSFKTSILSVQIVLLSLCVDIKDARIMSFVFELLHDEDDSVRRKAAYVLGEMRDSSAVEPLLRAMQDTEYVREAVVCALGILGDVRAVTPLIEELGDASFYVRKQAAVALGKIGDTSAIKPLEKVSADDKHIDVRKAAALALAVLRNDKTEDDAVVTTTEIGANGNTETTTKNGLPKEQEYVKDCLSKKYDELPEATQWSEPAFQKVIVPLNSGDNEGACRTAEALANEYGDFGILYWWWGSALRKMGLLDKARQIMTDALPKVNEKYSVYSGLAEVEWEARDLGKMVYWLAQAMHAQESLNSNNYGSLADSYLHLSYIAQGLGLHDCSDAFLQRVDSINYSVRLNPSAANDLVELTQSGKNSYIEEAIKGLVEMYI